jgi:hypothetical protein
MLAEHGRVDNGAEAQRVLDALNGVVWCDTKAQRPSPMRQSPSPTRESLPSHSPAPAPTHTNAAAPPAPLAADGDSCECIVLGFGQANPDCPKCGGTGYTGP